MSRADVKSKMAVDDGEHEHELETFDSALRGKYAGTAADERDMRMLGKTQVLNVCCPLHPSPSRRQPADLVVDSAIFGSSPLWASPVPS